MVEEIVEDKSNQLLLLRENVPSKITNRVLHFLEGPQKLLLRQVSKDLSQLIDQYRSKMEERKSLSQVVDELGGELSSSGESSEGAGDAGLPNFARVAAQIKAALLNSRLSKKVSVHAIKLFMVHNSN